MRKGIIEKHELENEVRKREFGSMPKVSAIGVTSNLVS